MNGKIICKVQLNTTRRLPKQKSSRHALSVLRQIFWNHYIEYSHNLWFESRVLHLFSKNERNHLETSNFELQEAISWCTGTYTMQASFFLSLLTWNCSTVNMKCVYAFSSQRCKLCLYSFDTSYLWFQPLRSKIWNGRGGESLRRGQTNVAHIDQTHCVYRVMGSKAHIVQKESEHYDVSFWGTPVWVFLFWSWTLSQLSEYILKGRGRKRLSFAEIHFGWVGWAMTSHDQGISRI